MCSPCGLKMVTAVMKMAPTEDRGPDLLKQMKAGCYKKGDKYCLDYIQNGPPSWDTVVRDCGAPEDPSVATMPAADTCSTACKTTFNLMTTEWGCCIAMLAAAGSTSFQTYLGKQAESCGSTIPAKCVGGKPARFGIKVANLDNTWFETSVANKKLVNDLVIGDASAALGILPAMITTSGEKITTGGTRLLINVEFTSPEEAESVRASFAAIAGGTALFGVNLYFDLSFDGVNLSFDSLESLPNDAKVDPTASMSVEVEATIEDGTSIMGVGDTAGSGALAPSVMGALLVAVTALLF